MTAHREWTAADDARLGTAHDNLVAEEIGASRQSVRQRRVSLGIAAYVPPAVPADAPRMPNGDQSAIAPCQRRYTHWPPEIIDLFGRCTDREIASVVGCSVFTVARKRRQISIAPVFPASKRMWSEDDDGVVRSMGISEAAARLGRSVQTVTRRRKILGLATDDRQRVDVAAAVQMHAEGHKISHIATALGVSRAAVRYVVRRQSNER